MRNRHKGFHTRRTVPAVPHPRGNGSDGERLAQGCLLSLNEELHVAKGHILRVSLRLWFPPIFLKDSPAAGGRPDPENPICSLLICPTHVHAYGYARPPGIQLYRKAGGKNKPLAPSTFLRTQHWQIVY